MAWTDVVGETTRSLYEILDQFAHQSMFFTFLIILIAVFNHFLGATGAFPARPHMREAFLTATGVWDGLGFGVRAAHNM